MQKKPPVTERKILSFVEACKFLGVSDNTFRAALKTGEIKYRKLNKRYLFSKDVLEQWVNHDQPLTANGGPTHE